MTFLLLALRRRRGLEAASGPPEAGGPGEVWGAPALLEQHPGAAAASPVPHR